MESLECQIINKSDSRIIEIEKLRREVFHVDNGKYFIREISNDKIIVIGCFLQKKLVGGAYISLSYNSLFIESIFVEEKYQRNALHVGSLMFQYILNHKNIFEKIFNTTFHQCRLESRNQDSFYEKLGFREEDNVIGTMKRSI